MDRYSGNLVWIDLEMTGLIIEKDTILEIATMVTNNELEVVAVGPSFMIHQSDEVLEGMDDWNKKHHGASGLIEGVRASSITLSQAEQETLEFIKLHCKAQLAPLCGNSVWQDRIFLRKYMPLIDQYLNYRIIDVSSIKEAIRRWYPENPNWSFVKTENHRALEDISQSIEELKHYKKYFFCQIEL